MVTLMLITEVLYHHFFTYPFLFFFFRNRENRRIKMV